MTKPPIKKLDQSEYIKTNLRLPPKLHASITKEAELQGRSMNAEILARLQVDQNAALLAELADIKAMLRKLMDQS